MKYILLFISISTILLSSTINESLLKIHATIVPKILLMDYDFKKKIINKIIKIAIVYENNDYKEALLLKRMIEQKYQDGLKSYDISLTLLPYTKTKDSKIKANLYYIFPSNVKNIQIAINKAKNSKALTFSYQKENLQNGVMSSVDIGSRVKPILNLEAVKMNNITFRPLLLKISLIYSQKVGS